MHEENDSSAEYEKQYSLIDEESGEVIGSVVLDLRRSGEIKSLKLNELVATENAEYDNFECQKRHLRKKRGPLYMMLSVKSQQEEAAIPIYSRVDRVWRALLSKINYNNRVYCEQKEIAEIAGIDKANVSRAIKELEKYNRLMKVRRGEYFINPGCVYCGPRSELSKAVNLYSKLLINKKSTRKRFGDHLHLVINNG